MFTQFKLHSNSIWMGATHFLCTIDVLFISVNVVTLRGRIASLNKTGLWAFIRGAHTQRHLRSLGMCRRKKNISYSYFNLSVLKGLMNKSNSAKLMKSNDGKRGMIQRKLQVGQNYKSVYCLHKYKFIYRFDRSIYTTII